jgi:hypothetical protein
MTHTLASEPPEELESSPVLDPVEAAIQSVTAQPDGPERILAVHPLRDNDQCTSRGGTRRCAGPASQSTSHTACRLTHASRKPTTP